MKTKFAKLRISDIVAEQSDSVYVINKAGDSRGNSEAGKILFTMIPGPNEAPIGVIVPHTWAPFDLTTQISKEVIVKNASFVKAVGLEMLQLVYSATAEEYLKSDKMASLENDRANQSLYDVGSSEEDKKNKKAQQEKDKIIEALTKKDDKFATTMIDEDPEIAGKDIDMGLIEIVNRYNLDKDVTENEMYSTVRSVDNKSSRGLNSDEKEYIRNNVNYEKVLKFINDN